MLYIKHPILHTLPSLFLIFLYPFCLPAAIVDSVDENLQASRRVLLLYNASTFTSKRHTSSTSSNNNNITKINYGDDKIESKTCESTGSVGFDGGDRVVSDTRQQLECMVAMNRALLEGSIKVRQSCQCIIDKDYRNSIV
ncbi:hypothetical protein AMECASPLE_016069 [Ameca splendens]|uniref:Uncharacterized protein n=1 Tax=Ameca splendens TaxID=208324 RepID=A0ABV0Z0U7_9TELE